MTVPLHGKLLLYEDLENNFCEILGRGFQKLGLDTQVVSDSSACIEAVRTSPPDVVLMLTNNIHRDLYAFEVATAIREIHPRCGFVFIAGCEEDRRERFLTQGYQFHVHPIPIPIPELRTIISNAIDSPMETFVIPKSATKASEKPLQPADPETL